MKHFTDYSFLRPAGFPATHTPAPDPEVAAQLGLDRLFTVDVLPYFTSDPAVLTYRAALFSDLDDIPQTRALLCDLHEQIGILSDLCRGGETDDTESCVRDLVLLSVYTHLMRTARDTLADLPLRSEALCRLRELVSGISEDEELRRLDERLARATADIENIKSVTIAVNLNAQLRPCEAGVVAIHSEYFKSGEWIDRLLRLELRPRDYTCIAPLSPLSSTLDAREREQIDEVINGALNKIFRRSVKLARTDAIRTLRAWCRELLPLHAELTFLLDACRLIDTLREHGGDVCPPTYRTDGTVNLIGLYDPHLLLAADPQAVVRNRFTADRTRRVFLLTGPNSGGKTVFTVGVAICYLFAGLGLPLPATHAEITPAANLFVHFPVRDEMRRDGGRLEEECRRLAEIRDRLQPGSVVFMDETFHSTGAEEAAALAATLLDQLRAAGALCLFSTHLHALAKSMHHTEECVSLTAEPNTFRITEHAPDGVSYAAQIARRYGLA